MARVSSLLSLVLLLPVLVHGANDWSQACFDGSCSWDVVDGSSSSGGMTLSGSSDAISDITTAAGWEILSCETTDTTSTVRIVCSSDDTDAAGCEHLEQHGGAQNKLVRLPTGCGAAPFARVADIQVSDDQSIPASTQRRLHRRSGVTSPQVKQLTLDIDWSAVPVSKHGEVKLYITGANVPGAQDVHNTAVTTSTRRRSDLRRAVALERRGFFSSALGAIGGAIKSAASDVGDAVKSAASDVVSGAEAVGKKVEDGVADAVSAVSSAAQTVESAVSSADSFNETKTIALPPVNFDKAFTLINKTLGCGEFTADLNINGSAKANASISVGVVAVGTIIPPKLSQFQALISGNADFDGALKLQAGVKGKFSTGAINLVQPIGITPFEIPGIFTLGPSIELTGQVNGDLALSVDMDATVSYSASNLQIFFPPQDGQTSTSNTSLNNTPLKLSLSPGIEADGTAEVHLTPTVQLGLNAFDNKVQADIFVDFDAALKLDAKGEASTAITSGDGAVGDQIKNNGSFSGSVDVQVPLSFNVGAKGDFFGLFDANKTFTVFSHTFDVFSKTFGDASAKRSVDVEARSLLAPSSIREREAVRLAERALLSSTYFKRGAFAVLAGRQDSSECPAEESSLDEVTSSEDAEE